MFLRIFFILSMMALSQRLYALDNEFKVWLQYQYAGHFLYEPKLLQEFETQLRLSRLGKNELDVLLIRGGLGYEIMPAVNILAGYEWNMGYKQIDSDTLFNAHEYIVYQQLSWSALPMLNFRTRLEQRDRSNQPEWNWRARIKAVSIAQTPLFGDLQPMISEEIFMLLNHPDWVSERVVDQNRLFLGFQYRMSDRLWWQFGYMNQYIQRNHAIGALMNHIASFSLAYL